jgi:hypothetical protein
MLEKNFVFQSAQPLSAVVESGQDPTSEPVLQAVTEVLKALGPIDALVLAPDLQLLDPADQMVEAIEGLGSGELFFNTTGPAEQVSEAAQRAFGVKIGSPTRLDLETLDVC